MSRGRFLNQAQRLWDDGTPWADLPGDALAFVLAGIVGDQPCLVVVDEDDAAHSLVRAARFFHDTPSLVELFPSDDVRPYDGYSPGPELAWQRIRVLHRLGRGDPLLVVAPVRALMQRVPDAESRAAGTRTLQVGDQVERDHLVQWLTDAGYLAAARANQPGAFAVHGDVIDVWSAGLPAPRRIDFFDDEVEEIRRLDPETFRPVAPSSRALLLPAREDRLDADAISRLARELGRQVGAQGRGTQLRRRLVEELRAGIRFSAIEDYLPALVPTEPPLTALAGLRHVLVHPEGVGASAREFWRMARRRWTDLEEDERPLVPPSMRYSEPDALLEELSGAHRVFEMAGPEGSRGLGALPVDGYAVRGSDLAPVAARIAKLVGRDMRVGLVAASGKRAQMLDDLLEPHGLELVGRVSPYAMETGELSLLVGDLPRGFVAKTAGWALIPAAALFGGRARAQRNRTHEFFDVAVRSVAELKVDEPVVHRVHGIGLFRGLVRIELKGVEQDFARLEFAGGDLMYVPATMLGDLSRYTPARQKTKVKLDRLGGTTWERRKGKVSDSLLAMAQQLLELHAKRELAQRLPIKPPGTLYRAFEARFPYTETVDQAQAILDVQEDLSGPTPMDRLICGDVGFGKTEVAMRAAMRVVESSHQVAVLCPTTVLAFQHVMTFRERFADLPVRIEMLSRFTPKSTEKEILASLRSGEIDIVIGTSRLLSRSVRYANLGLFVVDEEHRFGVKQKANLKKLREAVDVLAMSATPIPRTLQMALGGLREMSIMATPPTDRLSVRTTTARFKKTRVRDALLHELNRGGQSYFLHNRVETIHELERKLKEWVPEVRFGVAHGKMGADELEGTLLSFMRKEFDVLICTSIVESGVDLPNVNTMIVHRADMFGLSQLYQLRGRVGRGSVRANCLLLTPEEMTRDARKRLAVLVENTKLGSGFSVAAADLELRGGGNLLGDAQSGQIDAVGYEVWVELLGRAVAEARGDADRERIDPEVEVSVDAFIPDHLVPDLQARLGWYRKISNANGTEEVDAVLDDMRLEVGDLPAPVQNLAGLARTRLLCRRWGVVRCSWLKVRVLLELHPSSRIRDATLDALVAAHPKRFSVETSAGGAPVLAVRFTPKEAERPFRYLRWIFARFPHGS